MPELTAEVDRLSLVIEVGGTPIRVNTVDPVFFRMLQDRYAGFISQTETEVIEFDVDFLPPEDASAESEVKVANHHGRWSMQRGDFHAEWEPASGRGWIRQLKNSYSLDTTLRIVHTLVLARQRSLLLHSASAIRNGKAFLFAGVSGAGKTTMSRMAPADTILLTDEISYVRARDNGYIAFGTPFAGELAKSGENVSAPIAALYLLAKGSENKIDAIPAGEALRSLLSNVLFFAEDEQLVQSVFHTACDFVSRVPVLRLTFVPDARVWELIG